MQIVGLVLTFHLTLLVCHMYVTIAYTFAAISLFISTSHTPPQAGSSFILTCSIIELVDHSGSTVISWRDALGRNLTSGGDVTVMRLDTTQRVDYSLQFNPLRVAHDGQYSCEASIPDVGYYDSRTTTVHVTSGTATAKSVSTVSSCLGETCSLSITSAFHTKRRI